MAADCVADGDYLGEYSRFFAEFVARVNPDDQLPVKVSVYDVNESELVGEIISVTLQYLNRIYCPPSLQSYIARLVIQAIKSTCKKQPEICGLRQQEKTYAPLKLMQAVTNEVNEICRRYLDNSRLALLPPPSSTPQVTVGAIRNSRRKMEDRHMILHDLNTMFNIQDDTIVDYYAVFDGHGGQDAAAYCATHLHQYLVESVHYPTDPERALRDAFLTTDTQFIAKSTTQKLNGGTTAVCVLLINKKLYIAWVGDSMASLVTYGNVKQLVDPHRPSREDESERIRNMGGVVVHCMGVLRVNGFLSISRAIGDVPYKPYISGEPEIRCVPLDGTEDFLIIACDGLWDYVGQRTAALRVYRQILQNPYDLKNVHQALLQSAKRAGSADNITVIVVFLTSPIEIASRTTPLLTHQAPNGLLLNNMDPNNPSNHDQIDVKPAYIKRIDDDMDRPDFDIDRPDFDIDRPDFDMNLLLKKNSVCDMARNGKHRDDDDDEYDYTDIGPETDVDAGEDVHDNNYPPHATSSSLDPSPESEKSPVETEKHNDDDRNDNDYSNRDNANVCPVDSVVDDADVDNRVRPSDRDVRGADDETLRDNGDDDARVETTGTHTVVDDDESPPSPRTTKPLQHELIVADNVADSEDSEDGWDYYRGDPKNQQSAAVAADESREEVEKQSAEESPREEVVEQSAEESPREEVVEQSAEENPREEVEKQSAEESPREEVEEQRAEENLFKVGTKYIKFPDIEEIDFRPSHTYSQAAYPCCLDTSDESKSFESDELLEDEQEEKTEQDMDFQLNPEAAEFVPLSSPPLPGRDLQDFPISGSPLKQTQAMDDIPVPSQSEFDKEVCYRPKEIGEDFSHDEHADLQNNSQSMDISEISSTKAEMGDDESITVMSTSQWPTDICSQWNEKTREDSESDLEIDIATSHNPMTMSLTPGNFEAAFEKNVDLNAVHILDDSSDGAEHVSTPPRSPQPDANKDCAYTTLSEDKNSNDVLRASTPQPQLPGKTFLSILTSENSSETKETSFSGTATDENEDSIIDTSYDSIFSDDSMDPSNVCKEDYVVYLKHLERKKRKMLFNDYEGIIFDPVKRSNKCILGGFEAQEQLYYSQMIEKEIESKTSKDLLDSTNHSDVNDAMHVSEQHTSYQQSLSEKVHSETASDTKQTHYSQMIEKENIESEMPKDLLDSTNHSDFNNAEHVSEQHTSYQQSLLSQKVHSETASDTKQTHYSQMTEKENIESEMPKDLLDSTNHSDFNDAVHVSEQHTSYQQSLLSQKVDSETASDTAKKTHYYAEFDHKIIPDKLDIFTGSLKTENSQSNDYTDYYKTEKLMLETANDPRPYCDFTLDPKEIEQFKKDEDNSNENDDNMKPENKTELNPSDAIQESTLMKNELQNKIETFVENVPTETLIDEQTEQEQTEKKAAELAPTNESFKEKIASENIPMKELEIEPQKIIEAAPEDSAMIDKSKEEVTGIVEATMGAAVIGTVTAVAMTSPMKVKTTTTTSAKRPTKTATSKATTASTTKTATKSTPTSPSKAISATMRTTTTSSATQLTTKKPATSTATRPKQLDGSTKAAISSTSGKTTITKTTTMATKAATTTATRTSSSPRVSSGTMRSKTSTTSSKLNSSGTSIEKKSTMSGDAKSVSKPAAKPVSASPKPTTTSTTTKTTLVKTSASNITSKPRPASATSAAKTTSTSKLPATGVNGASRPRTAPTSGGTTKPRESRTITATIAKSPLIDKQSKETVNKQISRSGASAPRTTGRVSAPIGTATGATKTRALSTGKSTGNASAISPTKKSTPASKTTPRTPSSATKRTSLSETKVLENGIPKEDVTKAAVITATSKPEDDVPRKDASPVNVPTDNQLIAD